VDDVSLLAQIPAEPRLWVWPVDSSADRGRTALGWQEAGFVVRAVRGRKMHRKTPLFDEFAAALQFPGYFGENWDALDECLRDLDDWIPRQAGYVLVVTEPMEVLRDRPADFKILVRVLGSAVTEWAKAIGLGESWDRPAVPFNVALQAEPDDEDTVADRWRRAGARLARLQP
jgi:RNAse (barnase) inhibitor barstar